MDDVGTGFPRGERLGYPRRGEVGAAVGEHLLRSDVDAALEDLDLETAIA